MTNKKKVAKTTLCNIILFVPCFSSPLVPFTETGSSCSLADVINYWWHYFLEPIIRFCDIDGIFFYTCVDCLEPYRALSNNYVLCVYIYIYIYIYMSGTIIRGTLKTPNSQLVTPISIKLQRPDGHE
jgi:hypothetical protein